jgi:hypothetical protein
MLTAVAAFPHRHVEQFGEQTLHRSADLGAPMNGCGQEAPVSADDESAVQAVDLVERTEVFEE